MSSARGAAARSSTARWRLPAPSPCRPASASSTLLHQAPLPLALLHQVTGIVVLTIAVIHAERLSPRHAAAAARFAAGASMPRGDDMIELTHRGGIAIVTMVHGKANALDIEFCDALAAQFEALRGSDAKAVVLTGQGRMFSAGVDLIRLSEGGAAYVRRFLPALHRLYDTVFFFPKPVVAAVNGHAIAGGCVLQACADRRIAARDGGRIGVTELLVGVPFPPLAFEIMRFATPPRYFAEGDLQRRDLSARGGAGARADR